MKKFTHPSLKLSFLMLGISFAILVIGTTLIGLMWKDNALLPAILFGTFFALFLLYGAYGYTRNLVEAILKKQGDRKPWQAMKEEKDFRRVVSSGFAACGNFGIGIFYYVNAGIHKSTFDALLSFYFLVAFTLRLYLVYQSLNEEKSNAVHAYSLTAWSSLIFSGYLGGLVLFSLWGKSTISAKGIWTYGNGAYAFLKLVFAIIGFVKCRKKTDYLLTSFSLVSLYLSFVSLFTLELQLVDMNDSGDRGILATGYILAGVLLFVGILSIVASRKAKKKPVEESTKV